VIFQLSLKTSCIERQNVKLWDRNWEGSLGEASAKPNELINLIKLENGNGTSWYVKYVETEREKKSTATKRDSYTVCYAVYGAKFFRNIIFLYQLTTVVPTLITLTCV